MFFLLGLDFVLGRCFGILVILSGYFNIWCVVAGLDELTSIMKAQGISLSGTRATDPVERAKSKLYADYQKKKERQRELHVLEKQMARHVIPNLFVSRRTDRSPNGFNCCICQKDVSFLSRGEIEIWRHARCKSHYLRDRRYRLDYEDVIYDRDFSLIPVSEISAELRAEIEKTPPVSLGKKNPFVEDEIDSIVGVPSNIPPSTLVGCLFDLLRSGGSQSLLRRLWMQFRTTLPVDSLYAQSTWSKTETFVVLTHTLYPRILRRVKTWAKDCPFSITFKSNLERVLCCLHLCVDGVMKNVVVLWEPQGSDLCGAELECLSRIYAILPSGVGPASLRGCSPTLFNALSEWTAAKNLPQPFPALKFSGELLLSQVRDSSALTGGGVDPLAIVDYLVNRCNKAVYQPWLMGLVIFHRCVIEKSVSFRHLTEIIPELVDRWADIRLFLQSDGHASSGDLGHIIVSSSLCLPRLCCLHIILLCYRANVVSEFDEEIQDGVCRSYTEFCFFYWSLLSKVKRLADLPVIENWSEYVGKPLTTWANVAAVECFRSEPVVVTATRGMSDVALRNFLKDCYGSFVEFIKVLGTSFFARSKLSSSLSCLTGDMLISGDEDYASELFQQLVSCFVTGGFMVAVDGEAACNEYCSFLVDVRRRNRKPVKSIKDCLEFIRSFAFYSCREKLQRVVDLVSVLAASTDLEYPAVEISFSGVQLPSKILQSSIIATQSLVLSPSFASSDLLTKACLEELKVHLPDGKRFLEDTSFRPWDAVYESSRDILHTELKDCFTSYYSGQVSEWRTRVTVVTPPPKNVAGNKRGTSTPRRGSHSRDVSLGLSPIAGSSSSLPPVTTVLPPVASRVSEVLQAKRNEKMRGGAASNVASGSGTSPAKRGRFSGRGK